MKLRWLLLATVPLGGCMTSGTNMHGDFACRAPTGTCAPMSSIDAAAIAGMGGQAQPIAGGPGRAQPRSGRVLAAAARTTATPALKSGIATTGSPGRTADRVLQIVFPAHIDGNGIYHDAATAHAVVEPSGWTDSMTGRPASGATAAVTPQAGGVAPTVDASALASLSEVIAAKGAQAVTASPLPGGPRSVAPAAVVPGLASSEGTTPASWSRDPSALNLREAAAGADGGSVADLDGANFDTPDVRAVVGPAAVPATAVTPRFKIVRWHGHKVRVPLKGQAAAGVAASTPSVRALNVASLDLTSRGGTENFKTSGTAPALPADNGPARPPTAVAGYSTRQVVGSSVAPTAVAPMAVAPSSPSPAASVPRPAGIAVVPAMTRDAAVASARVRAMAAPVIAGGISSGRAAAADATPDANPFDALVAAGNGSTVEPRR